MHAASSSADDGARWRYCQRDIHCRQSGTAERGIYAASKWALLAASEAMRMELDAHDIRILAYLPGGMVTKFWQTPSGRQHQPDTSSFMYPTEVADYLLTILDAPRSLYPQEILVRRGKKR